jgi:hypothetical protein
MHPVVVISCRRFGTTFRSHHRTFRMGPIGCRETSVINYHHWLRNSPEERSSQLLPGGSLNSRKSVMHTADGCLKANSHIPCRAHAVPIPCRAALIHTCHAAPLSFSDNAVSFVTVRVVAGNIRTASPTL